MNQQASLTEITLQYLVNKTKLNQPFLMVFPVYCYEKELCLSAASLTIKKAPIGILQQFFS